MTYKSRSNDVTSFNLEEMLQKITSLENEEAGLSQDTSDNYPKLLDRVTVKFAVGDFARVRGGSSVAVGAF